jgi:hypothetical protein
MDAEASSAALALSMALSACRLTKIRAVAADINFALRDDIPFRAFAP